MNERDGEGIASRVFVPELVDVETVEAFGEAGDVADDGGGAVAGLGEGDGALDAGGAVQDADSRLVLGDDGEDGGAAGGDAGERAGLEGDAAEGRGGAAESVGRGVSPLLRDYVRPSASEPEPWVRRSRVALIVVGVPSADARDGAIVARRSTRVGRARRWTSIDRARRRDRVARSRPDPDRRVSG